MAISKPIQDLLKKPQKAPPEDTKYIYPDHPFIVGYSFPENEVKWAVDELNKAFNQSDNNQNPKWAWLSGAFGNTRISLLEKFVGQRWEEDTSNINTMTDLISIAHESVTKDRFLGLLKSKLRRCCNVQNPNLLAWDEIFAAINEYISSKQKNAGINAGRKAKAKEKTSGAAAGEKNEDALTGEAKALALLVQHSDWSDTKIAKTVGVNRTTLYDWPKFKKAKEALKQGKTSLPKGSKKGETGNVEAWED